MKKAVKTILVVFALLILAWAALSAYFIVAGRDSQGECFCEYSPDIDYFNRVRALPPEANVLTHLKWLEENMPTNTTPLYRDYRLLQGYIDGTTNRQELADAARELIAAESNTFVCAKRLLDCQMLDVPPRKFFPISPLMRILKMSKVKAVCEASQGDIAKGRQTLMEVVKIGVLVMANESYSVELSRKVGYAMASVALDTASQPLFVDGEERFRGELRNLYCRLLMKDVEYARLAAKRRLDECWRYIGENCTTNRAMMLGHMLAAGRTVLPQTDFSDLTWKGLERQFIAALLTAFPGYAQYALQPNRRLDAHRMECARFCQKVDEPYDIEYARALDFGWQGDEKSRDFNPLHRNWLGEAMMGTTCYCGEYFMLFKCRFEMNARIVASACQSFKAKYGDFPERLDSLVPEFLPIVPRDPYDGAPLRYDNDKLFLWTPGEKLSFDGKVKFSRDGKPITTSDIFRCVYFIPNPEASDGATAESNAIWFLLTSTYKWVGVGRRRTSAKFDILSQGVA